MFTEREIQQVASLDEFRADYESVKQALVNRRVKQQILLRDGAYGRLAHFVEAVLASAPQWTVDDRRSLCALAAEIAETLSGNESKPEDPRMAFRSALLYELAALPALAASVISREHSSNGVVRDFFRRDDSFRGFGRPIANEAPRSGIQSEVPTLADMALTDEVYAHGAYVQLLDGGNEAMDGGAVASAAAALATFLGIGLSATELRAFSTVLAVRRETATRTVVEDVLLPYLVEMSFPVELLPAQLEAVRRGLLDWGLDAWGFAAPTGSGKTFLARLLLVSLFVRDDDAKAIYLVPSRALVHEVALDLGRALNRGSRRVLELSAQLVDLDDRESDLLGDASVVVMTPEKADLLLRLGADFLSTVRLAVVDEAHHIESGTRGALLELYLWRLQRLLSGRARFIFLSAVAPNIAVIANWLGKRPGSASYTYRPTRMRVGVYSVRGTGKAASGRIRYTDGTSLQIVTDSAEITIRKGICQLAQVLSAAGPVLVVAKGKRECENLASAMQEWLATRSASVVLTGDQLKSDEYLTLDARLEREMYATVPMRELVKHRIAYHHAGLPPNVRIAVENAIRAKLIDFVFATTTLAEGVNFPFSTVIVQALALQNPPERGRPRTYSPVTPRNFWNIAGRAGRPGFDREGQVILFEPSLGLERINATLDQYTDPEMSGFDPVGSALAEALREILSDVEQQEYDLSDLRSVRLPAQMSRGARGAINLLRVGVVHARASGIIESPEEIIDGSFANESLTERERAFARDLMKGQGDALEEYLKEEDAPSVEMVSELGLSLDTLAELREYVNRLENWQIENFAHLFYGGWMNERQVPYVVGPVAKRMAELEGPALGGFLSDIIVRWLSGVPFTAIKASIDSGERMEDLISVVYSRIQYLLPWGLWATDWIIEREAERRGINYDNEVRKIAHLADAGVPSFDALRLIHAGIERVDATRLARAYQRAGGGLSLGMDCIGWLLNERGQSIETIVQGNDRRRVDHRFFDMLETIRKSVR